jgi:hypothetical protein
MSRKPNHLKVVSQTNGPLQNSSGGEKAISEKKTKEPVFEYVSALTPQKEKEVMHSTYGVRPDPQVTSDCNYRCPECGKVFGDLVSYNFHKHEK